MTEQSILRPTPDDAKRKNRTSFLLSANLSAKIDQLVDLPEACLEPGNKKTGKEGGRFKNIMVWNLPAVLTCPGASEWCKSVCYNGDGYYRPEVFVVPQWKANYEAFIQDPTKLESRVNDQLAESAKPAGVRIHSSGDFFSPDYVQFWSRIVANNPEVTFWGYTRSWESPKIRPALESLRQHQNIELFASIDPTMSVAPEGWRLSYVKDPQYPDFSIPENLVQCPEEVQENVTCASCSFCLRKSTRGVLFNVH